MTQIQTVMYMVVAIVFWCIGFYQGVTKKGDKK